MFCQDGLSKIWRRSSRLAKLSIVQTLDSYSWPKKLKTGLPAAKLTVCQFWHLTAFPSGVESHKPHCKVSCKVASLLLSWRFLLWHHDFVMTSRFCYDITSGLQCYCNIVALSALTFGSHLVPSAVLAICKYGCLLISCIQNTWWYFYIFYGIWYSRIASRWKSQYNLYTVKAHGLL